MSSLPVNPYETEVDQAAQQYNISSQLLDAQEYVESHYNPGAVSPTGAFGISQFEPTTAASYGVVQGTSPAAINSQIQGQAKFMSELLAKYGGNTTSALSAYNAGAAGNWDNPQTTAYVSDIEQYLTPGQSASLTSANTTPAQLTSSSGGTSSNPLSSALTSIAAPVTSIFTRLGIITVGILLVLVALFGVMESDSQISVVTQGASNLRQKAQS